jgi:hypothetical protein
LDVVPSLGGLKLIHDDLLHGLHVQELRVLHLSLVNVAHIVISVEVEVLGDVFILYFAFLVAFTNDPLDSGCVEVGRVLH